jgi:hypothetical protein
MDQGTAPKPQKSRRGFAAMSAEKQREIASLGGKAAHAQGKAHTFDSKQAAEAGRKGGRIAQERRRRDRHGDEQAQEERRGSADDAR